MAHSNAEMQIRMDDLLRAAKNCEVPTMVVWIQDDGARAVSVGLPSLGHWLPTLHSMTVDGLRELASEFQKAVTENVSGIDDLADDMPW